MHLHVPCTIHTGVPPPETETPPPPTGAEGGFFPGGTVTGGGKGGGTIIGGGETTGGVGHGPPQARTLLKKANTNINTTEPIIIFSANEIGASSS